MVYEIYRKALAVVAMMFIQTTAAKSEQWFMAEDVYAGDLFPLPSNRAVKITLEYVDAKETEPKNYAE